MIGGGDPFYWKFRVKVTALERNRRFSTDIRSWRLSHNTYMYSEQSSINTNRKSTTRYEPIVR